MYPETVPAEVVERITKGELPSAVLRSILIRLSDLSKNDLAHALVEAFDNSDLINHVWSWRESKKSAIRDTQFDVWVISNLLRENTSIPWTIEYCRSEYERIQPALKQEAIEEQQKAIDSVSYEVLAKKLRCFTEKIECIQALWDGDSTGWHIWLSAVIRQNGELVQKDLAIVKFGSDSRLFSGTVPPWAESIHSTEVGVALSKEFDCEFYFPAPNEPDDTQKSWIELRSNA